MSRIQTIIEQVESGQAVDLEKVLLLQTLDLARVGETFLEETLANERAADEQFSKFIAGD